jgi:hypothetical protein
MVWLLCKSRQIDWRDWKVPALENKFWLGSFLDYFLKKGQNMKKKYPKRRRQWGMVVHLLWVNIQGLIPKKLYKLGWPPTHLHEWINYSNLHNYYKKFNHIYYFIRLVSKFIFIVLFLFSYFNFYVDCIHSGIMVDYKLIF